MSSHKHIVLRDEHGAVVDASDGKHIAAAKIVSGSTVAAELLETSVDVVTPSGKVVKLGGVKREYLWLFVLE